MATKLCPYCKEKIDAAAVVCSQCGRAVGNFSIPPGTKLCPYCAEEIKEKAIVCKHCGRDLEVKQTPRRKVSARDYSLREIFTLNRLLDFSGKANRKEFAAIWFLPSLAIFVLAFCAAMVFPEETYDGLIDLLTFLNLLFIPAYLAVTVRRFRDMDMSPWNILLMFIPIVNFVMLLVLLLNPGQRRQRS